MSCSTAPSATPGSYEYCGNYDSVCSVADSCCIYVSSSSCGARISVNSMICVPKSAKIAKGDLLGINSCTSKFISVPLASTVPATSPLTVYAAQSCGAYYMASCDFTGGASWTGASAVIMGAAAIISLN